LYPLRAVPVGVSYLQGEPARDRIAPRRVALVTKAIEGKLDLTGNFTDHMYKCLACLACNDICPAGIKPADLCLGTRYVIHQARRQPFLKPWLFHGVFPRTGLLEALTSRWCSTTARACAGW